MKNKIKIFEDLRIWQEAHLLVLEIYKITKNYPKDELFGITFQLRRAGSSIPANIVEGFYLNTTREFIKYLYNAKGSTGEVIYFLFLSKDLKYISEKEYIIYRDRYEQLAKSINALINSLNRKHDK